MNPAPRSEWLSSASGSWACRWPATCSEPASPSSGTTARRAGPRSSRRVAAKTSDTIRAAVAGADVVALMLPDSPDVEAGAHRPGRGVRAGRAGCARRRLLDDPSRCRPPDGRGGRARRRGSARCARERRGGRSRRGHALHHGRRTRRPLRLGVRTLRCRRSNHRPRRAGRGGPDGEGREPAHRRRDPRTGGRGTGVPRGERDRPAARSAGAEGRTRGQCRPRAQVGRDGEPQLLARLPPRPAPQGSRDRARRGTAEGGGWIPLGALAAQLVASLVAQGKGDLDHSALVALVEDLSGRYQNNR